jgi:regulator of sigma E protease
MVIATKANRSITLRVQRGNEVFEKQVTPDAQSKFELGDLGILPEINPETRRVSPGEPAETGGLKSGDVILAVGGERNVSYERLVEIIRAHPDKPLAFDIKRPDGSTTQLSITPHVVGDYARVGAEFYAFEVIQADPTFGEAIKLSVKQNWEWTTLIMTTLKGLFTRETPMKQLMGPIGIAEMSGNAAETGWIQLFTLMAMISLNLGLLNLMPIPVLDGGHILILALEGVSRRDFSLRVKEKMLMVGFVVLLTLMVTVIYNDLTRVEWLQKLNPFGN